jgi:hypothetical protein
VPAGDGDGMLNAWTLKNPITTGQLALGAYQAEVSASDSGGDSVSGANAGPYQFENEVFFSTFTSNGTAFDYNNQDVTFSGNATFLAPGGSPVAFADATLNLTGPSAPDNKAVMTDMSGAFTVTVPAADGFFQMEYAGDPTTLFAASNPILVSVTQSPVTIHAALAVSDVNQGARDSVRGTVTYTDNGITKPLTGQAISLYKGAVVAGKPAATTVTSGTGTFRLPVPTKVSGSWSVATSSSEFLLGAQADNLRLTVRQANKITGFHASLNSFAVVRYTGCITGASQLVLIEYRAKRTGPWLPLRHAFFQGGCQQGTRHGRRFGGSARARLAGAYYRAVYPKTTTWQAAASSTVYLHKFLTKITSFSVRPQSVSRGGSVTVSGRLWAQLKSGKWQPDAGRHVIVVFRYHGTWYRYRAEPTTNSAGRFTGTFKVHATSPFFAQYNGDATHFASASKRITVTAAAILSAQARTPLDAVRLATTWQAGRALMRP